MVWNHEARLFSRCRRRVGNMAATCRQRHFTLREVGVWGEGRTGIDRRVGGLLDLKALTPGPSQRARGDIEASPLP